MEPDIFLFCYRTTIEEGTFEQKIRQITWNYNAQFGCKPDNTLDEGPQNSKEILTLKTPSPKLKKLVSESNYSHMPWPWITTPPNEAKSPISNGWDQVIIGMDFDCWKFSSSRHSTPPPLSPKEFSDPFSVSSRNPLPLLARISRLHCRSLFEKDDEEESPIPVLSPLGRHRPKEEAKPREAGVNHYNLIQLIGKPAFPGQPSIGLNS